jgi:Endoplasmic Reticulum-Golgi Intermediate Compartment (ERGIC)
VAGVRRSAIIEMGASGVLTHISLLLPTAKMSSVVEELSLLDKIDAFSPAPLKSFDAFPKLPSTYRPRSSERGILTLFITFIAFLLVANDIGEFIWGWPDYEFGIDYAPASYLDVNVDLIVNMPCRCAKTIAPVSLHIITLP